MMRRLSPSLLLFVVACGGGGGAPVDGGADSGTQDAGLPLDGGSDAGVDAGAADSGALDGGVDAGVDGGVDGGICTGGQFTNGALELYVPPPSALTGVTDVRSTVWVLATLDGLPGGLPVPAACVSGQVLDPDGGTVASTLTMNAARVELAFTPTQTGTWRVKMEIAHAVSDFELWVSVVAPIPPDLTLPRACATVDVAGGLVSCDDTLYSLTGTASATLDGGRWLSAAGQWVGWQDGALGFASFADGGVAWSGTAAAPFPLSWSDDGAQLAIGGSVVGAVFTLDGGAFALAKTLPPGWVDVLDDGEVLSLDLSTPFSPLGQLWSANASQVVALTDSYQHRVTCYAPDAGGLSGQPCDPLGWVTRYVDPAPARPLPRRLLEQTTGGVRLDDDGGSMDLADAGRTNAGDDFVWESNATQTAIWFR